MLRPRLHPEMGEVVICARVARQLAYQACLDTPDLFHKPSDAASLAARELPPDAPAMLKFALHSLSVYLDLGMPSAEWLNCVLRAAHFGNSFRRCFFFEYKDNRRPYPPVSNTGVHPSQEARSRRIRKGRVDV